jgi:hypothetical protein
MVQAKGTITEADVAKALEAMGKQVRKRSALEVVSVEGSTFLLYLVMILFILAPVVWALVSWWRIWLGWAGLIG